MSQQPSFDASYSQSILVTLREKRCLDDTAVMQCLYLLNSLHTTTTEDTIRILDSHYVAMVAQRPRARNAIRQTLRETTDTLILVPIFHDAHWSLLFFVPTLSIAMHLDSCAPYHRVYVTRLVSLIDPDVRYRMIEPPVAPPQQLSIWECGLYLLMNAYMLIVAVPLHLASCDALATHLTRHIASIGEHNRPRFTRKLIKLIERVCARL